MPILTKHPFMTFLKNGMWHHISSLCRDTLTSSSSSLVCMNLIGSLCLRVGDFSSSSESLLLMWEWKKNKEAGYQQWNSHVLYSIVLHYILLYCVSYSIQKVTTYFWQLFLCSWIFPMPLRTILMSKGAHCTCTQSNYIQNKNKWQVARILYKVFDNRYSWFHGQLVRRTDTT